MTYNAKDYRPDADTLVIADGGVIDIKTGGKILTNGTQAAAITAPTGGQHEDPESRQAINAIISVLENLGIVAAN